MIIERSNEKLLLLKKIRFYRWLLLLYSCILISLLVLLYTILNIQQEDNANIAIKLSNTEDFLLNETFSPQNWEKIYNKSADGKIQFEKGVVTLQQGSNSVWIGLRRKKAVDLNDVNYLVLSAERTVADIGVVRIGLHSKKHWTSVPDIGYLSFGAKETGKKATLINVSAYERGYLFVLEGSRPGLLSKVSSVSIRKASSREAEGKVCVYICN